MNAEIREVRKFPVAIDGGQKWFVTRQLEGQYVEYLHADGQWRTSTASAPGKLTGYYNSEADARAAMEGAAG